MAVWESLLKPKRSRSITGFLLTLFVRLVLVISITAFGCGLLRTVVFYASPNTVLSNSRSGMTLVLNATVLDLRTANNRQSRLQVNMPHPDDSGLFLRSDRQQFVTSVRLPGFHIIAGGWGVCEQGTVAFVMAEPTSTAFVLSHSFFFATAFLCNVVVFVIFRRRFNPATRVDGSAVEHPADPR